MSPAPGKRRGAPVFPLPIGILLLLFLSMPASLWAVGHPVTVKEINPGGNAIDPNLVNPFATIGTRILFAANDGTSGTELWVSDGSDGGTAMVKDVNPGAASASPQLLMPLNGTVVFQATEPASGAELWVTDGTAAGTQLLADIYPGTAGSTPRKFARVGNTLYFVATTAAGTMLWKTDGTPAGTTVATEFTPTYYSYIDSVTAGNGTLLVVTCTSSMTISWDLWRVDPAAGTTVRVTTLLRQPKNVTSCGGRMFFSLVSGTYGDELWLTDGTESGTTLVKDIDLAGSAAPSQLFCLDATLYFRASEPTTGIELWKSDGTPSGTLLVKDINPGTASSYPWGLKAFNGRLLLQASDGTTGGELWVSDGSAAGTVQVKDINPGSGGYVTTDYLAAAGTLAVFSAIDGVHGDEVWVTDGTAATTFLLADLRPGGSSSPRNFTVSGNTLFFSAYDQNTHYTLFAAPLTPAPHSLITSPLTGTVISSSDINLSGEAHSDTGSPVSLVEVSLDGGSTYLPATGTALWSFAATLPADGVYDIRARATDGVGNQELPFPAESIQVTLDSAPPSGFLRINGGAPTTASTQVTLEVTASAVDPGVTCTYFTPPFICGTLSARYSNNGTGWSAWEAASSHKSWSLLTGDGPKTVFVELKDRAGNTTSTDATITLDTSQVPSSTITTPATGFATSAGSVAVSGTAAPGSGGGPVTLVEVSTNGGTTWQAATGTTSWNITLGLPAEGTYAIRSRASAGSLQESPASGITVSIDRTPPTGTLTFYYGEWTLNASDPGLICIALYPYICGTIDISLNGTTWLPATTSPGTGGPLWLRDKAGNISTITAGSYGSTIGGPVQLPHATPVYYSRLQHAYDAALNGDLIKLSSGLTESPILARSTTVTIRGGHDSSFGAATGTSTLSGNVTVQSGAAVVENVIVQGVITIAAGEVTANGLSVR